MSSFLAFSGMCTQIVSLYLQVRVTVQEWKGGLTPQPSALPIRPVSTPPSYSREKEEDNDTNDDPDSKVTFDPFSHIIN